MTKAKNEVLRVHFLCATVAALIKCQYQIFSWVIGQKSQLCVGHQALKCKNGLPSWAVKVAHRRVEAFFIKKFRVFLSIQNQRVPESQRGL